MRMHTYADGLRAAAVYAQDYLHAADVQQLQRVLYRFAAIAECDECGTEHVHHINGVKVDNRPQNLVVLTKSQHARAHGSLNALLPALISGGFIEFDHKDGTYRLA